MKSKTRLLLVVLLLALTFTFALAACEGKEATPVSVEVPFRFTGLCLGPRCRVKGR